MNVYRFADLNIGMEEEFTIRITPRMMEQFFDMTGDENPLHADADFARGQGYRDRVVYGMLTASMLSTLAGVYLPGKYSLIEETDAKFVRPVYIGDQLTVTGKVTELHESVEQMVMKVTVRNQNGEKVLRGKMKTGFLHER